MQEKYLIIPEEWLLTKKISVKHSTYCKYENIIKNYLIPYFKEHDIHELTEIMIIQYIDDLIKKNLSKSMIHSIQCTLKAIYRYGMRTHGLKKLDFKIIKFNQTSKSKEPLNKEQERTLWKHCLNNFTHSSLAISLGLYGGLRIGEICALTWEDFDIENAVVSITKTAERLKSNEEGSKTKLFILEPKTQSSKREVILPDFVIEYIKHYVNKENSHYYILSNKPKPLDPRTIQKHFKTIREEYNINATFHTLRHTFATNCIKTGIDVKTLSEMLGHSNVNITLNRYVHTSFDFKKQQINKIESPIKS